MADERMKYVAWKGRQLRIILQNCNCCFD